MPIEANEPHRHHHPGTLRRRLGRGEVLHLAGDPPGRIHVVVAGGLKLVARAEDGRESIVDLVLPGEAAGDVAAADGRPQPFDAIALVPTVVVSLAPQEAAPLLASHLAARVRRLGAAVHERSASAAGALAGRLLDLARAGTIPVPLRQTDLARLTGSSRETICRELARLRASGAVAYRGRSLRILRPDVLERLRCGRVTLPSARASEPSRSRDAAAHRRPRSTGGT